MIKKAYNNISNLGIEKNTSFELFLKIRLTNQLAVIVAFMAFPFTFICYFNYPEITIIPLVAMFTGPFILWMNHLRFRGFSRVVLTTAFMIMASLFHAFIVPKGELALTGIFMIQFSLAIIPFVVFKLNDTVYILPIAAINIALLIFFESYNEWFSLDYDSDFMRFGVGYQICVFVGIGIALANIVIIGIMNLRSLEEVATQLDEIKTTNASLQSVKKSLESSMAEVEQTRLEEKKRIWQNEGMAQFTSLLRQLKEAEVDLDQALSFIVSYLETQMGAIYLVERDGRKTEIILQACYAYDRSRQVDMKLEPGEGLVGQSFKEEAYIHLREIPESYAKIQTGGLEIPPKSLLIVPMILNGSIEGFIELASVKYFEEHHIQLVHQLGEALAISLSTERANQQTRKLLEQSQEASEALRSQEEELRQNMEELAATQEEIERRNSERERQMKAANAEIDRLKKLLDEAG